MLFHRVLNERRIGQPPKRYTILVCHRLEATRQFLRHADVKVFGTLRTNEIRDGATLPMHLLPIVDELLHRFDKDIVKELQVERGVTLERTRELIRDRCLDDDFLGGGHVGP